MADKKTLAELAKNDPIVCAAMVGGVGASMFIAPDASPERKQAAFFVGAIFGALLGALGEVAIENDRRLRELERERG